MIAAAAHGPSALWYATRGAGAMALVLLTVSIVLGIAEVRQWSRPRTPRFAVAAMHRTISLLAVALLAVHIVTTLLDPFPPIGVLTAVVPFVTSYRPLWVGLGTLAFDLLIAVAVTSVIRGRLGYRAWRGVHWFSYACWPLALLHGLGVGSDTKATWMLSLTLACVAVVSVAAGARLVRAGLPATRRNWALATAAAAGLGLAAWTAQGPLTAGWPGRAGTPASVLAAFAPQRAAARVVAGPDTPGDAFSRRFSTSLSGPVNNGTSTGGLAVIDLQMRLSGSPAGTLRIRLGGQALQGGGLRMDRSAVTLGPPSRPSEYSGRVDFLQNSVLRALVGSSDGRALRLIVSLSLAGNSVSGRVLGTPVPGAGA